MRVPYTVEWWGLRGVETFCIAPSVHLRIPDREPRREGRGGEGTGFTQGARVVSIRNDKTLKAISSHGHRLAPL